MSIKRAWIIRRDAATTFGKPYFAVALECTIFPGHFDMAGRTWASRAAAKRAIVSNRMGVFTIIDARPDDLQPVTQQVRDEYHRRSQMRRDAICAFSNHPRAVALKQHLDALDEMEGVS